MKTKILTVIVFLLLSNNVFSQLAYYSWTLTPSPTTNNLNFGYMTPGDATNLWAVGNNGTIIHSTNSGTSWFNAASGSSANLYGIFKSSNGTILSVGANGTVIKSTDDGSNWQNINTGLSPNIYAIRNFVTSSYAIAVGSGGTVIYTSNSGTNWISAPTGVSNDLFCIAGNASYPKLLYAGGSDGKILRINLSYPPVPPTFSVSVISSVAGRDIKSITMIDSLNFYISGTSGLIYLTTDGGITWANKHTSNSNNINAFIIRNTNDFFAFESGGIIERTQNAGAVWIPQISYTNQNINSAFLSGFTRGFAFGNSGVILNCYMPDSTNGIKRSIVDGNRIKAYFENNGVFNQNTVLGSSAGFIWPNPENKSLIFTSGLNIAGMVNGTLRMSCASYGGEYWSGSVNNYLPFTNEYHKIYFIKNTDNCYNSIDYANWGNAVSQGAPYTDVNHNGVYDPCIDIPGYPNSSQTMFMCLTDGYTNRHSPGVGMGGGTLPMNSQLRITTWCYTDSVVKDVQYIKFQIINSGQYPWQNTFMALYADPDVGDPDDDYIGCDVPRNLGYAYNGTNNDAVYGAAPPSVGMRLLRFAVNKSVSPNDTLKLSAFSQPICVSCNPPVCETDPWGEPQGFYNMIQGYKKDGSPWMDPTFAPPQSIKTKFPGDPETRTNWTEARGSVLNCGGSTGTIVDSNSPGDRRFIMGWGASNWTMNPGDTQVVIMAEVVGRGSNNLNSVTKMKAVSDSALRFFNGYVATGNSVSGNVKFIDNNQIVTSGYVKALKLNKSTGLIQTLDSAGIQSNGNYILPNVPIDSCYIGVYPNSTVTPDFVMGYYPSVIFWQQAVLVYPYTSLSNINILVNRMVNSTTTNIVSGKVIKSGNGGLKDAILYIKSGNNFVRFGTTDYLGIYQMNSVPNGSLKVIVNRIGFSSDSVNVAVNNNSLDSINFVLNQMYVRIKMEEGVIPQSFKLFQNYPNPFNPVTTIKFQIPLAAALVSLKVYDLLGREVEVLLNQSLTAGSYEVTFDAKNLSSGIYFYKLISGDYSETKRMVLIK